MASGLPSAIRYCLPGLLAAADPETASVRSIRNDLQALQASPPDDPLRRIPADFDFDLHKKAVNAAIKEAWDRAASPQVQDGETSANGAALEHDGDAALAAKLQREWSSPSSRSTRGGNSNGAAKKRKRPGKSSKNADAIDSDEDGESGATSRSSKPARKRAPNPNSAFNRPLLLSPQMAEVCGSQEMARYEVVKQLWVYIKGKELQNPSNRRQIQCDETLTKLFGKSVVE